MPLPTPHTDETQEEFVHRCMGSNAIKEFSTREQQLAVCFKQYKQNKSKASQHIDIQASVEFDLEAD